MWSPLPVKSRRPHHHPNEHTKEEIDLIKRYHKRNPTQASRTMASSQKTRNYTRCLESLYRVMKKLRMLQPKATYKPKPYEQMTYPGERIQVDVKVVPRKCIADPEMKLYQYTAIDEYARIRFLCGYEEQSTLFSRLVKGW